MVKYADTEKERQARRMQKAMQQFAQLNISPLALMPGYPIYAQACLPSLPSNPLGRRHPPPPPPPPSPPPQLLQQQAAVAGLGTPSPVYPQAPALGMGISGLLSPTSPTHGASPLSSGSSGTGLTSPGLTGIPTGLPTLSSLSNGLPTLSPNGLASSTEPLHSPLHRYCPPVP